MKYYDIYGKNCFKICFFQTKMFPYLIRFSFTFYIDLIRDGALEPGATNAPLFYSFIAEEETDSYVNKFHTP